MACDFPIKAFMAGINENGKKNILFRRPSSGSYEEIELPCSKCIGCRISKARSWAARCQHEASLYDNNSFITLTYNDYSIPYNSSLRKKDLQLFIKRLRKRYKGHKAVDREGKLSFPIRYFACGEYGSKTRRPHYHIALFNFDFDDKIYYKNTKGNKLYISQKLTELWSTKIKNSSEARIYDRSILYKKNKSIYKRLGWATVGSLTYESAAYVADYCVTRKTGDQQEELTRRYGEGINKDTGEIETFHVEKEFLTMSRRPGIGKDWFDLYGETDVYNEDLIEIDGRIITVPKYYDLLMQRKDLVEIEKIKEIRKEKAEKRKDDNTFKRRIVKNKIKLAKRKTKEKEL